jgi:hypothetical protein
MEPGSALSTDSNPVVIDANETSSNPQSRIDHLQRREEYGE